MGIKAVKGYNKNRNLVITGYNVLGKRKPGQKDMSSQDA